TAHDGVGQDRGELHRLIGGKLARRFAEGPARAGLGAKLAVGTPFGDVEINFQDAPLRQYQVEPKRERKFERLADKAASRPEEQIFGGLLGDSGGTAGLDDVVVRP